MQLLRSLIFNLIFYPLIIFASIKIIVLYPFISRESLQKVASFWVMTILFILKIVCRVDWEVKGIRKGFEDYEVIREKKDMVVRPERK